METEECIMCSNVAKVVILEEDATVWGNPTFKYGEHHFTLKHVRVWKCTVCNEEYYDYTMMQEREQQLNELIKAKLGIDWLAECQERRNWCNWLAHLTHNAV